MKASKEVTGRFYLPPNNRISAKRPTSLDKSQVNSRNAVFCVARWSRLIGVGLSITRTMSATSTIHGSGNALDARVFIAIATDAYDVILGLAQSVSLLTT